MWPLSTDSVCKEVDQYLTMQPNLVNKDYSSNIMNVVFSDKWSLYKSWTYLTLQPALLTKTYHGLKAYPWSLLTSGRCKNVEHILQYNQTIFIQTWNMKEVFVDRWSL